MKPTDWNPFFDRLSPVFEPLKPLTEVISSVKNWPTCQDLENLKQQTGNDLVTHSGIPVRFVPQVNSGSDDFARQYESGIYQTGIVPTRPGNWHDFFNALVWMTFPLAKVALNRMHYHALTHAGQHKTQGRGAVRDAATLFDESGVIVLSSQARLIELLRQHEWKEVFWRQRKTVLTSMRFVVFGHAMYEKALNPYIGMTGKSVFFQVKEAFLQQPLTAQLRAVDQRLADFLLYRLSTTDDLSPVPVLGYPGWFDANGFSEFYDNQEYFRPRTKINRGR
ncbi:MAG: DUF3025 domain-containing protein [Burkholderiales bacterium]|nr:DUF3025 domain-containing protein [Burkholderiales bacterium]MDR4517233.1 DUF3025 domain-containing protein [Nitrosomonas sp.]